MTDPALDAASRHLRHEPVPWELRLAAYLTYAALLLALYCVATQALGCEAFNIEQCASSCHAVGQSFKYTAGNCECVTVPK